MIRQIYRLTKPRQIEVCHSETEFLTDEVLVKPEYLAICAADRRYYNFERPPEIMRQKIPIALIHEASGAVYYDFSGEYKPGDTVVLVPTVPSITGTDYKIKENYRRDSKFYSSSSDGYMQSIVPIKRDRLIKIDKNHLRVYVLCELLSVAVNAIQKMNNKNNNDNAVFGVWGDGSVSYVVALTLRFNFPNAKILIFGKNDEKLLYFSFVDNVQNYTEINAFHDRLDYAFECVGDNAVGVIIDEMLNMIKPQGTINLLGVSEYKQSINTRMILEKGLTLKGHSRSAYDDFIVAVRMINENKWIRDSLMSIISEEIEVTSIENIHKAFERDTYNDFKTILRWRV